MSFFDDLKAQVEAPKQYKDVSVRLNGHPYTLRFTQLEPWDWADRADRHPARPDVQIDRTFGYNLRALARDVAPISGALLVDGELEPVENWEAVWKGIGPSAVQRVTDAIFQLHEQDAIDGTLDAARKVLSAAGKKSASR